MAGLAAAAVGAGIGIEVATGDTLAAVITGLAIIFIPMLWSMTHNR